MNAFCVLQRTTEQPQEKLHFLDCDLCELLLRFLRPVGLNFVYIFLKLYLSRIFDPGNSASSFLTSFEISRWKSSARWSGVFAWLARVFPSVSDFLPNRGLLEFARGIGAAMLSASSTPSGMIFWSCFWMLASSLSLNRLSLRRHFPKTPLQVSRVRHDFCYCYIFFAIFVTVTN